MSKLRLMAVFAHPDDEAFGVGGTLARYAAEGHDVYLVTATRGEAGEIHDPRLASEANLPQVREEELRCACEVYGIHQPRFLDYVDGQLAVVHQGQAVGKLVRLIRELSPHVLLTFGPYGVYGHYDHIAVHTWTTIAYNLAADESCFPDQITGQCIPHQASKLYYLVLPEEIAASMSHDGKPASVMMDGVPFPMVGWPREKITTVVDIGMVLQTKLRGLQCHATQINMGDLPEGLDQMFENPVFASETFVLAASSVGFPEGLETDLLRGLR